MAGSARYLLAPMNSTPKLLPLKSMFRYYSEKTIKIEKRIERGPTDILKALSGTLKVDKTAMPYVIPDDPFFANYSFYHKRNMILSMDSGRKAAKYVFENNPELFKNKIAEPNSEVYMPRKKVEELELNENELIKLIEDRRVKDAIAQYDRLMAGNIEVSKEGKQMLLELVCFYNEKDPESMDDITSKYFALGSDEYVSKTWSDDCFANKLFQTMDQDCPLAYSAIIMGMLKYNEVFKAYELFLEARKKNLILSVEVYNGLLEHTDILKDDNEKKWEFMKVLLEEMDSIGVCPNVYTLNAIMRILSFTGIEFGLELAMKTLAEFKNIGIQPSLGTYNFLIDILCSYTKDKKVVLSKRNIIEMIFDDLNSRKLEIQHPADFLFFCNMLYKCSRHLKRFSLIKNLLDLLWKDDNQKFLVGNREEEIFYSNFLGVAFETQPIEDAMEYFKKLVPVYVIPPVPLYINIFDKIAANSAYDILPFMWKETVKYGHASLTSLLEIILKLLDDYNGDMKDDIGMVFEEVAHTTLERIIYLNSREDYSSGRDEKNFINIFTHIINLYAKMENLEKSLNVVNILRDDKLPMPTANALVKFCKLCASNGRQSEIIELLELCESKNYFELPKLAKEVTELLSEESKDTLQWVKRLAEK